MMYNMKMHLDIYISTIDNSGAIQTYKSIYTVAVNNFVHYSLYKVIIFKTIAKMGSRYIIYAESTYKFIRKI